MQDNWNIEELSDQAWHKMSAMLDQEMPVQDGRKKRPAFWWLFAAGILLAVLVAFFQWSVNAVLPESQIKSLPIPQQVVAENKGVESSVEEDNLTKATRNEASITASKINEKNSLESRKPQNLKTTAGTEPNKLEALQNASPKPVNNNRTLDPKLVDKPTLNIPTLQKESEQVAVAPIVESTAHEPRQFSEIAGVKPATLSVNAIPGLPIEPFVTEASTIGEFQQHLPGKSAPVSFELGAGIISKNLDAINGAFTELRTGLRLGKYSKFSIISGIGLHYQQEPFLIQRKRSGDNLDEAVSVPVADQGNGLNNAPNVNQDASRSLSEVVASNDIQVSSIFLDAPIALNWQFAPRWSFELGGRLSWQLPGSLSNTSNLSAERMAAQPNSGFTALDMGSRSQFTFYQPTSSNTAAVTTLTFRNWSLATTAAINFKLNPKWTLRLQYQYGLTNRLDNKSYQMLDRTLWLGVGRRF